MIISRTPLRISFFGGGSDYPQWYNEHGGAILGTTIAYYCYVTLHGGRSWVTFDLPNKSGLGSSSAYTVGLLRVCSELDKLTIARVATIWEQDKTNGQVGSQDQYLCAVGGFHLLKFSEHGIRDTLLPSTLVAPLQEWLMLFDTHQYRRNGDIIPSQLKEMAEHEEHYQAMAEMPAIGAQFIKEGKWREFGFFLDRAWQLKQVVAPLASTPKIDEIYRSALEAGALGGKLLGGGGGGFITFIVEPEKQGDVREALSDLTCVPVVFEEQGSVIIYKDGERDSSRSNY